MPLGLTALVTLIQLVVPKSEFCCRTKPFEGAGQAMMRVFVLVSAMLKTGSEVTVKLVKLLARPPAVMTEIIPLLAPKGTVAAIVLLELTMKLAFAPLNITLVAVEKFVPLIVMLCPIPPLAGEKLAIAGAGVPSILARYADAMESGTAVKNVNPVASSICRGEVRYACHALLNPLVTFGTEMLTTRLLEFKRLKAVPLPKGTTTAIFQVLDAMKALPLGMVLVPKPLGPQMMSNSLVAASARQYVSKFSQTPELLAAD